MGERTTKKVVVSRSAIKRAGERNTKASARLEDREVPPNHRRSEVVEAYLASIGGPSADIEFSRFSSPRKRPPLAGLNTPRNLQSTVR